MCLGLLREAPHHIKASLFWYSGYCSRCSVVSIVKRLWAGRSGARIPGGAKYDLFFKTSTPALGSTQPPMQWTPGFSPGGKEAAAWSSPPSCTYCEVKSCTSASQYLYAVMAWTETALLYSSVVWSLANALFLIISTLLLLYVQSNPASLTLVYATPRV
jgi:hypothetical protein